MTCLSFVSPRAGVEVIREWSSEDRPGGKPQEANRRQAHVFDQMFASYTKGQWLWGRGLLERKQNANHSKPQRPSMQETLRGTWSIWWCFEQEQRRDGISFYQLLHFRFWARLWRSHTQLKPAHLDRTLGWRECNLWPASCTSLWGRWGQFEHVQLNLYKGIKDKF